MQRITVVAHVLQKDTPDVILARKVIADELLEPIEGETHRHIEVLLLAVDIVPIFLLVIQGQG